MLDKLAQLADHLDKLGHHDMADEVDRLIRQAAGKTLTYDLQKEIRGEWEEGADEPEMEYEDVWQHKGSKENIWYDMYHTYKFNWERPSHDPGLWVSDMPETATDRGDQGGDVTYRITITGPEEDVAEADRYIAQQIKNTEEPDRDLHGDD